MTKSPIRLLVIEDDPEDAILLQAYLAKNPKLHTTLIHAESLTEGLDYLEQQEIDLVLCDLSLPDAWGLETFSKICSQFPLIPIIILSGLDDEDVTRQALSEGAQDYLIKGAFNEYILAQAIRYALERQQIRLKQQHFTQLLEQQVQERTQQLEQTVQQLRQKDAELSEALASEKEISELKSRIISTISHEYRTPLAIILSSTEMLQNYRHKWSEEKLLKHFGRIQDTVQHMTSLVNDILFINKAEFGKLEFEPDSINFVKFCQDLIEEQQSLAPHNHHLLFRSSQESIWINGDSKLLRQILTNLISNAIKYSPNGGKVSVQLTCNTTCAILEVSDQGIGIPPDEQNDLFESFSRGSNIGTIGGTGLGLSIVKECVNRHKGEIVVDSRVGVGTTFKVTLPVLSCPEIHKREAVIQL